MASLATIARDIQQLKSFLQVNDLISEDEAAKLRGITKRSLQVQVSSGKVPSDHYTINSFGQRHYFKSKLLGL